jgi:hypothetical protein
MVPWQKDIMESIHAKELKVLAMARNTGKSQWTHVAKVLRRMMEENIQLKITWINTAPNTVTAKVVNSETFGLREKDIDPIQQWCEQHHCGKRTSFDTFKFKNKQQLTIFLLRWGS